MNLMKRPPVEKAFRPNYGVLLVMLNIACCQVCRGVTTEAPTVPGNTTDSTNNSTFSNVISKISDQTTTTRIPATTTTTKCTVPNCMNCLGNTNSCIMCKVGYYRLPEVNPSRTTVSIAATTTITTRATTTTTARSPTTNAINATETAATTSTTVPVITITASTQSAASTTIALQESTHIDVLTEANTTATETTMAELTTYTCSKCKDHCTKCSNGTHCTECDKGYKMENEECIVHFWSKYLYFVVGGAGGGVILLVIICVAVCCIRRRRRLNSPAPPPHVDELDKHRGDEAKQNNTYTQPTLPVTVMDGSENISSGINEPKEGKKENRPPAPPPLEVVDPPTPKSTVNFDSMLVPVPPLIEVSEMCVNMEDETTHIYRNVNGNETGLPDYENVPRLPGQPQSDGSVSASCPQLPTTCGVMRHQPNSDQPRCVSNGSEDYYNIRGESEYYNGVMLPPTQN